MFSLYARKIALEPFDPYLFSVACVPRKQKRAAACGTFHASP
jgi:hypothetical protein